MKLNKLMKQKDLTKIVGLVLFAYFLVVLAVLAVIVCWFEEFELYEISKQNINFQNASSSDHECYFESDYCFNFYRCINFMNQKNNNNNNSSLLRVHVYRNEMESETSNKFSIEFRQFIETIINSDFYESNPKKACIFVPLIDLTNEFNFPDRISIQNQLYSLK